MAKKILKVVYIGFGIVFGFILFIAIYNSNGYNHIFEMTQEAIESGDYSNVAKIHGGCFEITDIASDDSDNLDFAVFRSSTLEQATYYVKKQDAEEYEEHNYNKYVNSYYIYVIKPNFTTIDVTNGDKVSNQTSLRFTGDAGVYDYYFKVDSTYNSTYYKEKPATPQEALLNDERSLINGYENWNFYQLVLTSTMVEAMNIGTINKISVCDNQGTVVGETSVTLDFSGDYFNDIKDLVDAYNTYISEVTAKDVTKEQQDAAVKKFNEFYEGENGFEAKFLANQNYSFRYDDKVLQPTSLTWSTVGLIALYVFGASLLFILCFHFNAVRKIFSRNAYKDYEGTKKNKTSGKNKKQNTDDKVVEAEIEEVSEPTSAE